MDTARFSDDLDLIADRYEALAATLRSPDPGVELMTALAPERVLIVGMGSSRYAASRVARAARARGMAVWDDWASAVELPPPADDLLVIAVSATGSSAELVATAERYVGRGRLIAVTNTPGSPLALLADATMSLHADREVSGVACRTYRHSIVALERLLGLTSSERAADELSRAAESTRLLLSTRDEWLPAFASALDSYDGTHVLAPAERMGSALQSALMIRELPRRLAVACETGDWAHVDLYTARTYDYRAAILTGSHWDAQAVEWLQSRHARYVAVGGELEGAETVVRFDGDRDNRVRVLVETLPFEIMAAEWLAADSNFAFSRRPVDHGTARTE